MTTETLVQWQQANRDYLMAEIARLQLLVERQVVPPDADRPAQGGEPAPSDYTSYDWTMGRPPAIETLSATFGLSAFERQLLLLCAGVELSSELAQACARARSGAARSLLTPTFAMSVLEQPHWSAFVPSSPLRHWHMVEIATSDGLSQGALRIDERMLHYIAGVDLIDHRVLAVARPIDAVDGISASGEQAAQRLADLWRAERGQASPLLAQLRTRDSAAALEVVAAAAEKMSLGMLCVRARDLPHAVADRAALARLLEREAVLGGFVVTFDCTADSPTPSADNPAASLADQIECRVVLIGPTALDGLRRIPLCMDLERTTGDERRELWRRALGARAATLNGTVERLAEHFDLSGGAIRTIAMSLTEAGGEPLDEKLWECCRQQSRNELDDLADRIAPAATWSELVLPAPQLALLREVSAHVRHRLRVFEDWGFASRTTRGLGTCAVFSGPSGTGKTMAAEVLADDLRLDLYRIDLSRLVSKYIGETEKNLARIFDAGERSGAILLFDEADALFGKRSEVKDSHDRYANIEVSYLLQRMEAYRGGLAILTTNMKSALDPAFWRRLRFVVQFPFPDVAHRAEIWRRVFPQTAPLGPVDIPKLARLAVSGGSIRSIAVNAAFRAAQEKHSIGMQHLLWAARQEYAKFDRVLSEAEVSGWA